MTRERERRGLESRWLKTRKRWSWTTALSSPRLTSWLQDKGTIDRIDSLSRIQSRHTNLLRSNKSALKQPMPKKLPQTRSQSQNLNFLHRSGESRRSRSRQRKHHQREKSLASKSNHSILVRCRKKLALLMQSLHLRWVTTAWPSTKVTFNWRRSHWCRTDLLVIFPREMSERTAELPISIRMIIWLPFTTSRPTSTITCRWRAPWWRNRSTWSRRRLREMLSFAPLFRKLTNLEPKLWREIPQLKINKVKIVLTRNKILLSNCQSNKEFLKSIKKIAKSRNCNTVLSSHKLITSPGRWLLKNTISIKNNHKLVCKEILQQVTRQPKLFRLNLWLIDMMNYTNITKISSRKLKNCKRSKLRMTCFLTHSNQTWLKPRKRNKMQAR